MLSILTPWLLITALSWELVLGALQPPRRVGMQAFRLMDTLWIDGGRFLHEDASVALEIEPKLTSYDLTRDFTIPDGPIPIDPLLSKTVAPTVYHGFTFSNLVDRAWLFGGRPVDPNAGSLPNDIWRFEPGADAPWIQLPFVPRESKFKLGRPYRGAGCNVPDLQKGFYLGGMVDDDQVGLAPRYSHWLYEFSMDDETLNVSPVPSFVPVINQSMVFIDTGTRLGALAVLGGWVEIKGSLSPAPLTFISIFDIESRIWIKQPVTGLDGNLNQDGTIDREAPDGGIPRTRWSGCATVGSAQDKTSHNIFYLGGVNETTSLVDIWVLSLPSAFWIKARPLESASGAKYENSCFLVNDRFIWMFGGCFLDYRGPTPCVGYSYNPLVYDMAMLRIQHYNRSINGFSVHENITNVIGGRPNGTGGASTKSPIYTNFADSVLEQLFNPPYSGQSFTSAPFFSDHRLLIYVIIFLTLPPVLAAVIYLAARHSPKSPCLHNPRWFRAPSHGRWRPTVFSTTFLVPLNIVPIFLIVLLVQLTDLSELPDTNAEHWSGGLDADGIWTGARFDSTFIRSPTLSRPPQGLMSFYQDKGSTGIWSQKNSTQRIGDGNYWAFSYLPTLIAILYGRLWKVLDDEVKRVDKYIRLRRPAGESLRDSLFLEYHSFWVPLSIFQALRRKHWRVAISSTGVTLGSIVVPIIQTYTFGWTLYSGAHLPWPDTYSWLVALVDPWWASVLVGILASSMACSLALLILLPRVETGLAEDPRGLESILYMVPEGFSTFEKSANMKILSELEEELEDHHVRLGTLPNNPTPILEMTVGPAPPTATVVSLTTAWAGNPRLKPVVDCASKIVSQIQTCLKPPCRTTQKYLNDYSLSFPFRPEILTFWILLLILLLVLSGSVATGLNQNARDRLWNYTIPLSPNVYLILAIFVQSIADVYDFSVRALYPFYELHKGARPPDILFVDYVASLSSWGAFSVVPIIDAVAAWWRGHHLVCISVLASMAVTTVTVFLGSLQLSSSFYGATSFVSDQTAATGAAWLTGFALVIYATIGLRIHRALGKRMRRPVETFMGAAPYLIFSEKLREDLRAVGGRPRVRAERLRELERRGGRYALGTWTDGTTGDVMLGVERQYDGHGRVDTMTTV